MWPPRMFSCLGTELRPPMGQGCASDRAALVPPGTPGLRRSGSPPRRCTPTPRWVPRSVHREPNTVVVAVRQRASIRRGGERAEPMHCSLSRRTPSAPDPPAIVRSFGRCAVRIGVCAKVGRALQKRRPGPPGRRDRSALPVQESARGGVSRRHERGVVFAVSSSGFYG